MRGGHGPLPCSARARPGRGQARRSAAGLLGGGVGDHEELVGAQVHHDLSVGALGALASGILFGRPVAAGTSGGEPFQDGAGLRAGRSHQASPPFRRSWLSMRAAMASGLFRLADPLPELGEDGHLLAVGVEDDAVVAVAVHHRVP